MATTKTSNGRFLGGGPPKLHFYDAPISRLLWRLLKENRLHRIWAAELGLAIIWRDARGGTCAATDAGSFTVIYRTPPPYDNWEHSERKNII